MSISNTPQQSVFPHLSTEEIQPSVGRFSSLPSPLEIRSRYLFGIPLQSALTGESLQDTTIDFYIKAAISEIEHTLDMYITPVKFYEKHDYDRHQFTWSYNYMKLYHSPILSVNKVELSFSNSVDVAGFVNFPLEHVHVQPQEGTIQLVPAFGTSLSGFLLSAFSGTQYHALRATGINNFPGALRVEYTAGFEPDKIPVAIAQLVGIMAGLNTLSAIGPILFPQNSVSISIDGVSQSTGNFGPKFLNDRIAQLTQERDRQMEAIKGYYQKRYLFDNF